MITSKSNDKIKYVRSLSQKKNRDLNAQFVCEGVKSVKDGIAKGADVAFILATQSGINLLGEVNAEALLVTDEVFASVSGEVTPQGVLAVVNKPSLTLSFPKSSCLFLDGVQDPANVGAIIRTAAAAGYTDIYLAKPSADAFSHKSVRASMSGIFAVNIYEGEKEELLKHINLPLYVADMGGENAFTATYDKKFCIVIGNEANGVSPEVKKLATKTLKIPMLNDMESLNAGVSAGILMYALKNFKGE